MYAIDFEYDGQYLSNYGFIICDFDFSSGAKETTVGSNIVFNKTSIDKGQKYYLSSSQYDECFSTTFDICKNPDIYDTEEMKISQLEYSELANWLNRKSFYPFSILVDDNCPFYYNVSFNISQIRINEILYGLRLTMETDAPFAFKQPQHIEITNKISNGKHSILSVSDDEGYIYPHTEITINQDGTLKIINSQGNRITQIKNCSVGEVITMDYPIIQSSKPSHKIQDDFNWNFIQISNSYRNNINELTISIPCQINMTYSPIAKIGI